MLFYTRLGEYKWNYWSIFAFCPQLQDEIHHLSKKGHANEKGGFNFLGGLKKKSAKLQGEIEIFENHEEMINKSLQDIIAGGGR